MEQTINIINTYIETCPIRDVQYNKKQNRVEFMAPSNWRLSIGNSIKHFYKLVIPQMYSSMDEQMKSSLMSSKCIGSKGNPEEFIGRLLMTLDHILNVFYYLNGQKPVTMPLNILERYMDVDMNIIRMLLQYLDSYHYIKDTRWTADYLLYTGIDFKLHGEMKLFMCPVNYNMWQYIKNLCIPYEITCQKSEIHVQEPEQVPLFEI